MTVPTEAKATGATGGVQSVERAFALLEVLATRGGEAGVGELSAALELPGPTVHRILGTLVDRGYVMRLPSRRYSLGPGLMRLGEASRDRLASWAMPALARLGEVTQETANLAVLDGDLATYVAQVPSKHHMRMFTEVGRRVLPHAAGVGKALLSQLPDEEVRSLVRRTGMPAFTDTTHTTEQSLLEDLATIRARGYAIDEGEQELGVRCFAVPVPGLPLLAAVSISGPEARVRLDLAGRTEQLLRAAAGTLRNSIPA